MDVGVVTNVIQANIGAVKDINEATSTGLFMAVTAVVAASTVAASTMTAAVAPVATAASAVTTMTAMMTSIAAAAFMLPALLHG